MRRAWLAAAAAAAIGVGMVWAVYQRDMAAARALIGDSRVIDSPYGAIEYAETGSGPTVLMIHGSGGGFDQGLAFGAPLAGQKVRMIAPSRFGYLGSAMPDQATPQMQADALAWLLKALGEEQAVIFGGSAGALSATQLALRHPEVCRGLVLGVPALYAPERAPDTNAAPNAVVQRAVTAALGSDFLFWLGVRAAPDFMTKMVLATDPALLETAPASERRRLRQALFRILPVSARKRGLRMDSATAGAPPPYPVERIGCPMLVISTRDDLYGTGAAAAYTASQAPSARLVLYDTGGHLWVGRHEAMWSTIADFIHQVSSEAAE